MKSLSVKDKAQIAIFFSDEDNFLNRFLSELIDTFYTAKQLSLQYE